MSDVLAATTAGRLATPRSGVRRSTCSLPAGRVVIELAPAFAPEHVANLRTLAPQHYFDGLAVMRSQDNFVVQWGDPDGKRPLGAAKRKTPARVHRAHRARACRLRHYRIATAMRRR